MSVTRDRITGVRIFAAANTLLPPGFPLCECRLERFFGIDRLWRFLIGRPVAQHKRDALIRLNDELASMHPTLGVHDDIGAQDCHVRACDRPKAVVGLPGHPGNDRAIVEPDRIFASHPDFAAATAHNANKMAAPFGSKWHEIDETDDAVTGLELGLQDGRMIEVPPRRLRLRICCRHRPEAIVRLTEQGGKDGA